MNEWRPIETAPKDGSAVMLWVPCGGDWSYTHYVNGQEKRNPKEELIGACFFHMAYWDQRDECWRDDGGTKIPLMGDDPDPTHWMPLPEPPGVPPAKSVETSDEQN